MSATLFLVGVGPGDLELLTLKAARILGEIKNIAYIQKPKTKSFAYEIAKNHINKNAKLISFDMVMENERFKANKTYDEIAKEILIYLNKGEDVAYICEGDGLFYGSSNYLIARMPEHVKVEIIAGISSPFAASASLIRPLVKGNETLKILPATLDDATLLSELNTGQNIILIKVGRHFSRIKNLLKKSNFEKSAMIVENASCDNQRIIKLNDYNEDELPYFSIILANKGDEI